MTPSAHCFVLMPFDTLHDGIYTAVLKPTVISCGFVCSRADELSSNHTIMQDIWKGVASADIILAELTDRNPNVFYELGIAHQMNKQVVLMTRSPDNIPFDLKPLRHIVYDQGNNWEVNLSKHLKETLMSVKKSGEKSAPPFWKQGGDLLTTLDEMGIQNVYRDRSYFDINRMELMDSAKQVSWLGIVPNLPAGYDMVATVVKHLKRGCNFKILAWNPNSPYQKLLKKSPELFPGKIPHLINAETSESMDRLMSLVKNAEGPGTLDVKLYDTLPSWYIQIIDKVMFVEPYLYSQKGIHTMMLQLAETQNHNNPFRYFGLHFDTLFEAAKPIQTKSFG